MRAPLRLVHICVSRTHTHTVTTTTTQPKTNTTTHHHQVLSWVFSYDGIHSSEPMAICAASAAVAISSIPLAQPVAGVQVGMVGGHFVVNPTRCVREKKSDRPKM